MTDPRPTEAPRQALRNLKAVAELRAKLGRFEKVAKAARAVVYDTKQHKDDCSCPLCELAIAVAGLDITDPPVLSPDVIQLRKALTRLLDAHVMSEPDKRKAFDKARKALEDTEPPI